jgi:hypothetical protein
MVFEFAGAGACPGGWRRLSSPFGVTTAAATAVTFKGRVLSSVGVDECDGSVGAVRPAALPLGTNRRPGPRFKAERARAPWMRVRFADIARRRWLEEPRRNPSTASAGRALW